MLPMIDLRAMLYLSIIRNDAKQTGSFLSLCCTENELNNHRRSQDFVLGALFFLEKVDGLFLVIALRRRSKTTK